MIQEQISEVEEITFSVLFLLIRLSEKIQAVENPSKKAIFSYVSQTILVMIFGI